MQRRVTEGGKDARTPAAACPRCGGRLVTSHREYAGAGTSRTVQHCTTCAHVQSGATRPDADRAAAARGRSRRHQPVDEGPPSNPVLDPDVARRLLEEWGG